ncbi:MAG: hypothetical protein M3Z21_15260 [Pseudomonadota bacterium]|nr:hypothetical protein [Pseudomonadota bacterium]
MTEQAMFWEQATPAVIAAIEGPAVLVEDQHFKYVRPLNDGETLYQAVEEWVAGSYWGEEEEADATNYLSLGAEILDEARVQTETACYLVTYGGGRESPEIQRTQFRETVSDDGRRLLT